MPAPACANRLADNRRLLLIWGKKYSAYPGKEEKSNAGWLAPDTRCLPKAAE
jgi:hypothetical protein